ncbi:c-type cytochrome [Halovulum sp. GXIMD14794]
MFPENEGQDAPVDQTRAGTGAALAAVSLPDEFSAEAQMGKLGFEAKCANCHGTNAAGQDGVAPPLVHKIYEPSHHGDASFWLATQNGVRAHHWRFGNMPPVDGLTRADVRAITTYVRELQRANGIR